MPKSADDIYVGRRRSKLPYRHPKMLLSRKQSRLQIRPSSLAWTRPKSTSPFQMQGRTTPSRQWQPEKMIRNEAEERQNQGAKESADTAAHNYFAICRCTAKHEEIWRAENDWSYSRTTKIRESFTLHDTDREKYTLYNASPDDRIWPISALRRGPFSAANGPFMKDASTTSFRRILASSWGGPDCKHLSP